MRLDVPGHRARFARTGEWIHVYLNGVNVSQDCTIADDEAGWAVIFRRGADGRFQDLDPGTGNVASDVRRGHIEFRVDPVQVKRERGRRRYRRAYDRRGQRRIAPWRSVPVDHLIAQYERANPDPLVIPPGLGRSVTIRLSGRWV